MILRRFNEAGMSAFRDVLSACRNGEPIQTPLQIASDGNLTETISSQTEVPDCDFQTRMELASKLSDLLLEADISNVMDDRGLWAWLSATYFDSVCPAGQDFLRNPGEEYRHIPSDSFRHYYRHLIRGAVSIYRMFSNNPEAATIILCQPPSAPGDFVEQLAARQERVTRQPVIATATTLYYDPQTRRPKKGAAPNQRKPGTLRRYLDILDQLSLTWDLFTIDPEDLLNLLPDEFDDWKPQETASNS